MPRTDTAAVALRPLIDLTADAYAAPSMLAEAALVSAAESDPAGWLPWQRPGRELRALLIRTGLVERPDPLSGPEPLLQRLARAGGADDEPAQLLWAARLYRQLGRYPQCAAVAGRISGQAPPQLRGWRDVLLAECAGRGLAELADGADGVLGLAASLTRLAAAPSSDLFAAARRIADQLPQEWERALARARILAALLASGGTGIADGLCDDLAGYREAGHGGFLVREGEFALRLAAAQSCLAAADPLSAGRYAQAALALDPADAGAHLLAGRVAVAIRDAEEARRRYRSAARLGLAERHAALCGLADLAIWSVDPSADVAVVGVVADLLSHDPAPEADRLQALDRRAGPLGETIAADSIRWVRAVLETPAAPEPYAAMPAAPEPDAARPDAAPPAAAGPAMAELAETESAETESAETSLAGTEPAETGLAETESAEARRAETERAETGAAAAMLATAEPLAAAAPAPSASRAFRRPLPLERYRSFIDLRPPEGLAQQDWPPVATHTPLMSYAAVLRRREPWFEEIHPQRATADLFRREMAQTAALYGYQSDGVSADFGTWLRAPDGCPVTVREMILGAADLPLLERALLARLVSAVGFHVAARDMMPGPDVPVTGPESGYALASWLFAEQMHTAGHQAALDPYFRRLYDQLTDDPRDARTRVVTTINATVNAARRREPGTIAYWRAEGERALARYVAQPEVAGFHAALMTSRWYRAMGFLPFLTGDHDQLRSDMDWWLGIATDLVGYDDHTRILAADNYFPAVETAIRTHLFLGDRGTALQLVEKLATEIDPIDPKTWLTAGELRYQAGDIPGARDAYQRAANLQFPYGRLSWFNVGQCHEQLGDLQEAAECYRRSLAHWPTGVTPLRRLRDLTATGNLGADGPVLMAWAAGQPAWASLPEAAGGPGGPGRAG
jgi:tetratricopeptide (TPR) repeat protein